VVLLKATNAQTRVYVNGSYVGTTGVFDGPGPRGFDQAQAFDVPAKLLAHGANTIHLQVNSPTADATGIDVVLAGPETEVRGRALRELLICRAGDRQRRQRVRGDVSGLHAAA
jgi:hypothetical protein